MITSELLKNAYRCGDVKIVDSPRSDGCVCEIGLYWFYFGGHEAEEMTAAEYVSQIPEEDILREIFDVLSELWAESPIEYEYYETYLKDLDRMRQQNAHPETYEIDRIICMSTAHISRDSAELLENDDFSAIAFPNPNGYGIIVRCLSGENHFGDGADDVASCIAYARQRGCGYIRFDRDFPPLPDLPIYEW